MRYRPEEAVRARRPDELERHEADERPEPLRPAEQLLALQRTSGNRAVTELLARAPGKAAPTGEKRSGTAGPSATLPDIGTIALLSVSFDASRPRGPDAGGGGGGKAESPKDIVVTSRLGAHSSQLSKAALDGKPMDVEIVIPRGKSAMRLSLKGAIVSSYAASGAEGEAIESWTLNFSAIGFDEGEAGKPGGKGGGDGSWDYGGGRGA